MRRVVGGILLAGMILALLPSALRADSNVANPEDLFPIIKNANGVSLQGQLAIYYDVNFDNPLACGLDQVNMFFVLRLSKGDDSAPAGFAGSLRDIWFEDSALQIATVLQFVADTVSPYFFPNTLSPTINLPLQPCPRAVPCLSLTAVKRIVQDGEAQDFPPYFFLMNVEFRVRR